MSTQAKLIEAVKDARALVSHTEKALAEWQASPENNVYESLEAAEALEDTLRGMAFEDCEGAGNCGMDTYQREFMVGDTKYIALLQCEYNRHDKTYYYLDEASFSITAA